MIKNIRIESDGTAVGTHVYSASGEKIGGVVSVEIAPIEVGGIVRAIIEFIGVELDLVAEVEAE